MKSPAIQTQGPELILPTAYGVLERWEKENLPLDDLLDDLPSSVSRRLRASVTSLLLAYFRHHSQIEQIAQMQNFKMKNRLVRFSHLVLAQRFFQQGLPAHAVVNMAIAYAKRRFGAIPAGAINKFLRMFDGVQFCPAPVLPEGVRRRWTQHLSEPEMASILEALMTPAPFTFRWLGGAEKVDFQHTPIEADFLPKNLFFSTYEPHLLLASEAFQKGKIYIQDPATFFSVFLFQKHCPARLLHIHDVCSAPGGKALLLAEFLNPERIVLSDHSATRHERTRQNLARCGVLFPQTKFEIDVSDATQPFQSSAVFDLVFLDVPCSNSGVFRRRPDAMLRFNPEGINALQLAILTTQSASVAPGGFLVYSTCSIEPMENEDVVSQFLARNPGFKKIESDVLYPTRIHDGASVTLLQRHKNG